MSDEERRLAYNAFDAETERLLTEKKVSFKVVDFLLQPDCGGSIRYGACKELLKSSEITTTTFCTATLAVRIAPSSEISKPSCRIVPTTSAI